MIDMEPSGLEILPGKASVTRTARRRWYKWRIVRWSVQISVSLAMLGWLAQHVEWAVVGPALSDASIPLVLLSCLMYYISVGISCYKWSILLNTNQICVPFWRLFRWYLIGAFASNFLPSTIGGDIGRAYYAIRYTNQPLLVGSSILFERFSGLLMMLVMAMLGVLIIVEPLLVVVAFTVLGMLMLSFMCFKHNLRQTVSVARFGRLNSLLAASRHFTNQRSALIPVLGLSLVFQILAGLGLWVNLQAVHVSLPLSPVVLSAAIANVWGVLPISVNGWGVSETVLVGLLTPLGSAAGQILAGALIGRVVVLVCSLTGFVPLLLEHRHTPITTNVKHEH